jgi:hypothetical protein
VALAVVALPLMEVQAPRRRVVLAVLERPPQFLAVQLLEQAVAVGAPLGRTLWEVVARVEAGTVPAATRPPLAQMAAPIQAAAVVAAVATAATAVLVVLAS